MGCHFSKKEEEYQNSSNHLIAVGNDDVNSKNITNNNVHHDTRLGRNRNRILTESSVESLRRIGGTPSTINLLHSPSQESSCSPDTTYSRDSTAAADLHHHSTYNAIHQLVATGVLERISSGVPGSKCNHYGVVGVRNLGNTCFMNSSIQCLSNTIPLTDYFLGFNYKKEINKSNVLGTSGELVTSYAKLMKHIWLSNETVVNPGTFKRKLEHFAPQFAGGYQQDAHELLAYLLDGIHEDLNRVVRKPYVEDVEGDGTSDSVDAMVAWQRYLQRNKSVVVDIFQGQLRNTLTCCECTHKSVKFDPFMYLSLPIPTNATINNNITLDDCLEQFCREEYLTSDNLWYCPKCKLHVNATKTFNLWTLPPILIIHLKRFKQNPHTGTFSKIEHGITYPVRNWDLSHVLQSSKASGRDSVLYDLYAVSNHYGGFGSGHYTAFAMNRVDDQWYHFNDSTATPISEDLVGGNINDAAYVLFYNRIIGSHPPTIPEDTVIEQFHSIDKNRRSLFSRIPVILRQSLNRPEHWPQLQSEAVLRDYKRPVAVSLCRRQNPHVYPSDTYSSIEENYGIASNKNL